MSNNNTPVLDTLRDKKAVLAYIKLTLFGKAREAWEKYMTDTKTPDCDPMLIFRSMGYSDALEELIDFYELSPEYNEYLERIEKNDKH